MVDPDENLSYDNYLDKISHPNQQVGELVLHALPKVLKKRIKVYYADCPPREYPTSTNENKDFDCIHIIYRDISSTNNGHYMALVKNYQTSNPN